jgi:hypothetical protein
MKVFALLVLLLAFIWFDLPDRWRAEFARPKPATVFSYSDGRRWRSRWRAVIKTEAGHVLTNSDRWAFRYLEVAERTEWTRAKHVYVGGFFLRWSMYFIVVPLLLALLVHSVTKLLTRKAFTKTTALSPLGDNS